MPSHRIRWPRTRWFPAAALDRDAGADHRYADERRGDAASDSSGRAPTTAVRPRKGRRIQRWWAWRNWRGHWNGDRRRDHSWRRWWRRPLRSAHGSSPDEWPDRGLSGHGATAAWPWRLDRPYDAAARHVPAALTALAGQRQVAVRRRARESPGPKSLAIACDHRGRHSLTCRLAAPHLVADGVPRPPIGWRKP